MPLYRLLTAAILAVLLSGAAHAGSFYLVDTGSQRCDNQVHSAVWINSFGASVNFTSALSWVGVDFKGVGDVWFFASRMSDGAPFTFLAWDHYANPTALHQFNETFNPPFTVGPGDGISVEYFCQSGAKHMQTIIKVQYQ